MIKITDKLLLLLNYQLIIISYYIIFSLLAIIVLFRNNWVTWFIFLIISIWLIIKLLKIKTKMDKINN